MDILTKLGLSVGIFAASTSVASAVSLTVVAAECDPNANQIVTGLIPTARDCGVTADRQDSDNVNLGMPDGNFYSLGLASDGSDFGGFLVLELDPAFSGSAMIFEVTNPSNHLEAANVYVSNVFNRSNANLVGSVDNGNGGSVTPSTTVNISGGPWKYLWIQDTSVFTYGASGSVDGFDIDSIKLTAIPVPATALLLGTALAGLGFSRRRRG